MNIDNPTAANEQRAEYIAGLRELADLLVAHPELELPFTGSKSSAMLIIARSGKEQREQLLAWAKALPGRREKKERDGYLDLVGQLRGLHVQVICDRQEVCQRIVTGTREVTREIPDPDAPKVTVTETVEEVRWECSSLLADELPADDVAALADGSGVVETAQAAAVLDVQTPSRSGAAA